MPINSDLMYYNFHTHRFQTKEQQVISVLNNDLLSKIPVIHKPYSAGLHPWHINEYSDQHLINLQTAIAQKECIAIGECGLDKLVTPLKWQKQLDYFEYQVNLSQQFQKPLIIHCVKAFNECLEILNDHTAMFHGFRKNELLAKQIYKKGHYLSFGDAILHTNQSLWQSLIYTPVEQLCLETDNSTVNIQEVYLQASKIRKCSIDTFILQLESNYKRLFNI